MSEFTVEDHIYRCNKMPAMTQMHVLRRLAPLLGSLKEVLENVDSDRNVFDALQPVANAIGAMSDDDSEYIISRCLAVCERKDAHDRGWQRVWNDGARQPMFDDITVFGMIQIAAHVLKDDLGPFSSALPQGLIDAAGAPNSNL